ncbi:MAG: Ig-like domain-containing protein [Betaproteobacteria bacterium]|nr:Ig-like domain-containing protein [Betaproteobacteria bacterium]
MSKDKNRHGTTGRRDHDDHDSGHKIMDKVHVILGTKIGEELPGTDGRDLILGKKGDDKIDGGAGNDLLFGGKGIDFVFGGTGDDFVFGGKGDDIVDGGAGNDRVFGGKGDDLANYTRSENVGAHDFYDGGKGVDTLQLTLTSAEQDAAKDEIAAFQALLGGKSDSYCDDGKSFHFDSLDLTVRNFEKLEIVTVGGGNTAPVATDDSFPTNEDTPASDNLLSNDTDVEDGQPVIVSAVNGEAGNVDAMITLASGALLTVNADGTFSYDPNGQFEDLGDGYTRLDSFAYVARDSLGADSNVATVSIVVSGVNDAPVAEPDVITTTAVDGRIRVAVVGDARGTYIDAANQLNTEIFNAHAILYTPEKDWAAMLNGYEVVVLGDSGPFDYGTETGLFSALRSFVDSGGGVITTGWFASALSIIDPSMRGDADYITPITPDGNNYAGTRAAGADIITVLDSTHEIAGGLSSFQSSTKFGWELAKALDASATLLATGTATDPDQTSQLGVTLPAIAYDEVGLGRAAYLGGMYLASSAFQPADPEAIRAGVLDEIFERAVAWAAGDRSGGTGATVSIDAVQLLLNDTDVDTPHDALQIGSVSPLSENGAAISFDPTTGEIVYAPSADGLQALLNGESITDSFDYTAFDGNLYSAAASVDLTIDALI